MTTLIIWRNSNQNIDLEELNYLKLEEVQEKLEKKSNLKERRSEVRQKQRLLEERNQHEQNSRMYVIYMSLYMCIHGLFIVWNCKVIKSNPVVICDTTW